MKKHTQVWLMKVIGIQGKRFTWYSGQGFIEKMMVGTHQKEYLPSTHSPYQVSSY